MIELKLFSIEIIELLKQLTPIPYWLRLERPILIFS